MNMTPKSVYSLEILRLFLMDRKKQAYQCIYEGSKKVLFNITKISFYKTCTHDFLTIRLRCKTPMLMRS